MRKATTTSLNLKCGKLESFGRVQTTQNYALSNKSHSFNHQGGHWPRSPCCISPQVFHLQNTSSHHSVVRAADCGTISCFAFSPTSRSFWPFTTNETMFAIEPLDLQFAIDTCASLNFCSTVHLRCSVTNVGRTENLSTPRCVLHITLPSSLLTPLHVQLPLRSGPVQDWLTGSGRSQTLLTPPSRFRSPPNHRWRQSPRGGGQPPPDLVHACEAATRCDSFQQ